MNSTHSNSSNEVASSFFQTIAESYNPAKLSRAIFEADSPEAFAAALPAQALYMTIQHVGIESAGDLISLATSKQYRTLLDFELWENDSFSEDNFWRWLEAIDEAESLEPTEKFLKSLDYQLLAVLFARHLIHVVYDDGNDQPPGKHFYTPDKGFTWIHIKIQDPLRHRLFGKLLAIIYESKSELFYQLIGMPQTTSETALEEGAFEDKNLRLREFGIPSKHEAWDSQAALNPADFITALERGESAATVEVLSGTTPIASNFNQQQQIERLRDAIISLGLESNLELEISHLANTALVVSETPFSDIQAVRDTITFIRDTLNFSLEYLETRTKKSAIELYQAQGAVAIYRVGLWLLHDLKTKARRVLQKMPEETIDEALNFVLKSFTEFRPAYPELFDGDIAALPASALINPKVRPFRTLVELNRARDFVSSLQEL